MTYFSPGPWRAVGPTIWPEGPSFDAIATVQVSNVDCWEQNARLIAAAPEMLDMLIKLRDSGSWYSSALEIDVYREDQRDGEELEADLKDLIVKATGAAA